jgi:hypothetical protein
LLRFDEVVSGAKLVRHGMAMQLARSCGGRRKLGCSRNGRLFNAFDQEPHIERKTVRMDQLPTRRL